MWVESWRVFIMCLCMSVFTITDTCSFFVLKYAFVLDHD